MEKKFNIWLALLAALVLVFAAGCDTSGDSAGGGSTTPTDAGGHVLKEDPNGTGYVENSDGSWDIYTLEGLKAWAEYVTDESNSNYATSATLVNCIEWEASGDYTSWSPIGDSTNNYTGTFDGAGHTVSNIAIVANGSYTGFFGYVGSNGSIEGLGLEIADFTASANAGGIAGYNAGKITGCWSAGDITANTSQARAGGIAGQNTGTITACYYSTGNVAATSEYGYAGGIAGESMGEIIACYSTGSSTSTYKYGDIAGNNNNGTATYCYYSGSTAVGEGVARNSYQVADGTTWKDAQDAMNSALATLTGDQETDWRFTGAGDSADASDAPKLTKENS